MQFHTCILLHTTFENYIISLHTLHRAMKSVLIITYYWPPSGGAGVQRWLKLSKYLCDKGVNVHVLTVDEAYASYFHIDKSLLSDIHPRLTIHKTKSIEPIKAYQKLVGKKNVPTAGFSNVDNTKWSQKLINSIRSNVFIPDPRKGWVRYAVKKGLDIIQKENISTIITSSPPHSSQLIGLKLQQQSSVKWIADLRDPWTDIYYYDILGHSRLSKRIDQGYEKKVLVQADEIITVSHGLKSIFESKDEAIDSDKIHVVYNGYDETDFKDATKTTLSSQFTLCYTGTMSDLYQPQVIFDALKQLVDQYPEQQIQFQLVGAVSDKIKAYIQSQSIPFEHIPTVPHDQVNAFQLNAQVLLLIIPDVNLNEGIVTGKLFEYLRTKNKVIGLGPPAGDANRILAECQSGRLFDRSDTTSIFDFLQELLQDHMAGRTKPVNESAIGSYSREAQAEQVLGLLDED